MNIYNFNRSFTTFIRLFTTLMIIYHFYENIYNFNGIFMEYLQLHGEIRSIVGIFDRSWVLSLWIFYNFNGSFTTFMRIFTTSLVFLWNIYNFMGRFDRSWGDSIDREEYLQRKVDSLLVHDRSNMVLIDHGLNLWENFKFEKSPILKNPQIHIQFKSN